MNDRIGLRDVLLDQCGAVEEVWRHWNGHWISGDEGKRARIPAGD